MDQNDIKELHRRFLAGELSGQELDNYLEQAAAGAFDDNFPDFEVVAQQYPYNVRPKGAVKPKTLKLVWRSVAAVAAMLLILGACQWWYSNSISNQQIVYKTIQAGRDKKISITLPDGSIITLSPGTTLTYPEKFTDTLREVFVKEGKAFFQVERDTLRPFRVHAGKLETTVLGTSFTVENYSNQGFEKINLYTGKVKIRNVATKAELALRPGQLYEWDENTKFGLLSGFDMNGNPADAESLSFKQASLKSVLYRIAYFKGIRLNVKNMEQSGFRVSGKFDGMTTDEILRSLAIVHPLSITKTNDSTYTIMNK